MRHGLPEARAVEEEVHRLPHVDAMQVVVVAVRGHVAPAHLRQPRHIHTGKMSLSSAAPTRGGSKGVVKMSEARCARCLRFLLLHVQPQVLARRAAKFQTSHLCEKLDELLQVQVEVLREARIGKKRHAHARHGLLRESLGHLEDIEVP